jgi:hypothetical protein
MTAGLHDALKGAGFGWRAIWAVETASGGVWENAPCKTDDRQYRLLNLDHPQSAGLYELAIEPSLLPCPIADRLAMLEILD